MVIGNGSGGAVCVCVCVCVSMCVRVSASVALASFFVFLPLWVVVDASRNAQNVRLSCRLHSRCFRLLRLIPHALLDNGANMIMNCNQCEEYPSAERCAPCCVRPPTCSLTTAHLFFDSIKEADTNFLF